MTATTSTAFSSGTSKNDMTGVSGRHVRTILPDTPVMSFFEVPEDKSVEVVAVIGAPGALPA